MGYIIDLTAIPDGIFRYDALPERHIESGKFYRDIDIRGFVREAFTNQAFCIAEEFGVRENHRLDQGTLDSEEMVAFQKFETRCLRNM